MFFLLSFFLSFSLSSFARRSQLSLSLEKWSCHGYRSPLPAPSRSVLNRCLSFASHGYLYIALALPFSLSPFPPIPHPSLIHSSQQAPKTHPTPIPPQSPIPITNKSIHEKQKHALSRGYTHACMHTCSTHGIRASNRWGENVSDWERVERKSEN